MHRLRETLTLALITLLPFHALLVTVGTKLLRGPGHAPWGVLAVWKEGLLAIILLLALLELASRLRKTIQQRMDLLDLLILGLLLISIFLFFHRPWMTPRIFALGFRYDFVPLIAFLVLRRVEWSREFWARAEHALLWLGGIIAAYGIITFFLLQTFFSLLGYSDAHSLYLPGGPLAAFQQISGSSVRRIQATFSGPNQLGMWLLIPLAIAAVRAVKKKVTGYHSKPLRTGLLRVAGVLMMVALFLTFSRSAWIAAFVIACVLGYRTFPRRIFREALVGIVSILIIAGVALSLLVPQVFFRVTSTWGHLVRPIQAIQYMERYPLGLGLGRAGPATNRTNEPCVFLPPGADVRWAKNTPKLCVFVSGVQQQPTDHPCNCALLPENWYLQIGVELGVIGFAFYAALIGMILWRLREQKEFIVLSFLGISVAALFLHAWEDSAVAYTGWILIAAISTLSLWRSTPVASSFSILGANTRI